MRVTSLLLAGFAASTTTAWSIPTLALRSLYSGQDVLTDIKLIDSAVKNLTATITAYKPPSLPLPINGLPVLAGVTELHTAFTKGFAHINIAPEISEADSLLIIEETKTLGMDIPLMVMALKGKKEEFSKAFLGPAAIGSLQLVLADMEGFGGALVGKVKAPEGKKGELRGELKKCADSLRDGVAHYSKLW